MHRKYRGIGKARLLNAARARGCTFNTLLTRYANERFLYRLGMSPYRDNFIHTFGRYGVSIPEQTPACFSNDFAHSPAKQRQWTAFIGKAEIKDLPTDFSDVVEECSVFLLPLLIPQNSSPSRWMAEPRCWIE